MSNAMVLIVAWLNVAAHIVSFILARKRGSALPYVAALNLVVGVCVVTYWVPRWYSYAFKGITYYLTDQALPLYFIVVIVVSALALSGRYTNSWPQWVIFGVDAITSLGAAVLFSTFRITKLF
jgi:hypothetical protein